MILDLKGIYKDYQQGKMTVPVLKDINFSMEEGEYVAIMGPSGSGKTTLMNIIGCLDKPTKGSFLLNGEDIAKCSENEMSDRNSVDFGVPGIIACVRIFSRIWCFLCVISCLRCFGYGWFF